MKTLAEDSRARIIAVYDDAAASYNRVGPSFFLHFGKRLAGAARLVPGSHVLDVATGTGAVLVPAARRVGRQGKVVGVDVSPRMVSRARDEIRDLGLDNACVLVADAECLPFAQGCFDSVLCSFAIFLFSNLSGLVSECRRVLRPPGTIGLVYSAGEDHAWAWYEQLLSRYAPTAALGTERYRPQDVEAVLAGGGFENVSTTLEVHQLVFSNAAEFWDWAWSHGDRAVLESLGGDRVEFKRELLTEFEARAGASGLAYQVHAAITLGARP